MVVAWEYQTPHGAVSVSPAIGADGTVYGGADDGTLYALDGDTGAEKWAVHFPPFVFASPAVTSAFGGIVYFGLEDGRLVALHTADGTTAWEFATGGAIYSSPTLGDDGTVYFGSNDHFVYAVDGKDGTLKWKFETNSEIWTSPAVNDDGVVFVASRYDGIVYAIAGDTGREVWQHPLDTTVYSSPALHAGKVFLGADDSRLHALSQADGSEVWSYVTGEAMLAPLRASPSITPDGDVVVQIWSGLVVCVNATSGMDRWMATRGEPSVSGSTVDADGRVFLSGLSGEVYRVDPGGAATPLYRTQSPMTSVPVIGLGGVLGTVLAVLLVLWLLGALGGVHL